ncbi:ROK family protein, partial [Streptomyces sp. SID1328]|uniref:ROK family protein n=1 Tax=Streptomyces sp. SID1328 TaxID=2690250 RepID=UPI001F165D94
LAVGGPPDGPGAARVVAEAVAAVEADRASAAAGADVDSAVGGERDRPAAEVDTADAGAGSPAARFLDALADRLAIGAAAVTAILDPGCVVLGGEVGQAGGEVLAARVGARLGRMSPLATEVRAGALGGAAVLRGALLTARDRAQDELFGP